MMNTKDLTSLDFNFGWLGLGRLLDGIQIKHLYLLNQI